MNAGKMWVWEYILNGSPHMMISAHQGLRCDNDVHNLQRSTKACKLVMKRVWFAPHKYHHHPEKLLPSYRATKLLKFANCGLALLYHYSWVQSIYQLRCHEIRFSAELLWLNPPPNYDMPSFDMAHGNSALNWTSVLTKRRGHHSSSKGLVYKENLC